MIMLWFVLSLFTALFESSKDLLSKRALNRMDVYVVAFSFRFFALPFLLPLLLFVSWSHDAVFLYALFATTLCNVVTTILYMKAIQASPLSVTIPMVTFTPAFLLLTSPVILGEFPGFFGIAGVLLIVIGSYMLNVKDREKGLFEPFRALLRERGPVLMLMVAFIWSISANLDKIAIIHSNPIFFVVSAYTLLSIFLFPLAFRRLDMSQLRTRKGLIYLVPIGFFAALMSIAQMIAFSMAAVAYVVAIKRMSSVFTAAGGHFFFGEARVKERILGISIMILGALFVTLL